MKNDAEPRFQNAKWISYNDGYVPFPLKIETIPSIRKSFLVKDYPKQAEIAVCGLGLYQLTLNGIRPTENRLMPLFTDYRKRVLYDVIDIKSLLSPGENVIGIILAPGFYAQGCDDVWEFQHAPWKNIQKVIFEIVLTYRDGKTERIVSDTSARFAPSAVTMAEIRNGESYDARLEQPGWDRPGFDDSTWQPVAVTKPAGPLFLNEAPPIRVWQTLSPVSVDRREAGRWVFDFGQNMAGTVLFSGRAAEGTTATFRYAELEHDGEISQKEVAWLVRSGDFQTDRYTFGTEPANRWSPSFTYHGFRYVEVTCDCEETPDIHALAIGSDLQPKSRFCSEDPYLNQLYRMTDWSDRSNFVGIPTDCPQREKNGWMSEGLLSAERILTHYHAVAAYDKWLVDMEDAMLATGELPAVVPTPGYGFLWGNGPTYDFALPYITWLLYRETGDKKWIEKHYPAILRSIAYTEYFLNDDTCISYGLPDWLSVDIYHPCSTVLTSTSYFYAECRMVSAMAIILGDTETAEHYRSLAECVKKSFNEKYVNPSSGKVGFDECGFQTAQCVPLYYGIINEANRSAVLQYLAEAVKRDDGHVSTGTYGTHCILDVLSREGLLTEAYEMVNKRDYPGWGFMVEKGATTLWEMWNAAHDDPEWYGSLNHNVYGSVSEWMDRYVAGLRQADNSVGYRSIIIEPGLTLPIKEAAFSLETIRGTASVSWQKAADNTIDLTFTVPVGSQASLILPAEWAADRKNAAFPEGTYHLILRRMI